MILRKFASSLSAKLLVMTILFVMLAEVLIFAPSVARFRQVWLEQRMAAGHLAALTIEAAPDQMVTEELETKLLAHVGAYSVDLELPDERIYMLSTTPAPPVAQAYDLRRATWFDMIMDAVALLVRRDDRVIQVAGVSPKDGGAEVELVLDEAPLRAEMIDFAERILALSVLISLITAGLVFLSLNGLMVRPMQRITASMMAFRRDPEDLSATLPPTVRADEIGMAQRELIDMQAALRSALRQKERLAALGTAVTKINHDLRNILSTAALVSERLAVSEDPEVRRVTPRLMQAIDRAVELCSQTLAYSRDGTLPLRRAAVPLAEMVEEVGAELAPAAGTRIALVNRVPRGLKVQADREQLSRALANLARNALEAGATEVTVAAAAPEDDGGRLALTVSDNGPGLAPRARENLFQPFAGSARAGGTGLGLAIAREVARAHGGDIRLAGSDSRGTCFVLELPLAGTPPT
ncbi:HAMP domain-containing histidine kinase [Skermanella mucosa]|uniref:sensor histidine kinase n=1 Tax=Skermanella mucosa TaxID=1789672 RepID=UPI00192B6B98|nr:HAMP domain-containing sensor histidine kinase [Skermanella mucosa]UEM20045.1 HAMP domain-containing histidine kinase [Skermanella mucosa]